MDFRPTGDISSPSHPAAISIGHVNTAVSPAISAAKSTNKTGSDYLSEIKANSDIMVRKDCIDMIGTRCAHSF
jgi:hypothetical protein